MSATHLPQGDRHPALILQRRMSQWMTQHYREYWNILRRRQVRHHILLRKSFVLNRLAASKSSPSSFIFIGNTNPLSCLLQEQDKAKIVDRTAGYRALLPRRPANSPRPQREYPTQALCSLDWYGAFAAAGHDPFQLRYLDKIGCFTLPPDDVVFSRTRVHPIISLEIT